MSERFTRLATFPMSVVTSWHLADFFGDTRTVSSELPGTASSTVAGLSRVGHSPVSIRPKSCGSWTLSI